METGLYATASLPRLYDFPEFLKNSTIVFYSKNLLLHNNTESRGKKSTVEKFQYIGTYVIFDFLISYIYSKLNAELIKRLHFPQKIFILLRPQFLTL